LFEDRVAPNWSRYRCDELDDRLVRQPHGVVDDAAPENLGGNLLLLGKAVVEPLDQNISINESGHVRKDPLFSIPALEAAPWRVPIGASCDAR
jgi:hypothetical protein